MCPIQMNNTCITQKKSSHATSSQTKRKYIIHVHTQAKREHDNQDECNKDGMLKDDQDNIQAKESTLRQQDIQQCEHTCQREKSIC